MFFHIFTIKTQKTAFFAPKSSKNEKFRRYKTAIFISQLSSFTQKFFFSLLKVAVSPKKPKTSAP